MADKPQSLKFTPVDYDPFQPGYWETPPHDAFFSNDITDPYSSSPHEVLSPELRDALGNSIPAKFLHQYGEAVSQRWKEGRETAGQGSALMHKGNFLLGVPLSLAGSVNQTISPVMGGLDVAGANLDPALGIGHAPPAPLGLQDLSPAIFAGVGAANADLNKLSTATKMEAAKGARSDVWNRTGWFRGADDKWRFEISDADAKYNKPVSPQGTDVFKLSDILDHPELYGQYPFLKDQKVKYVSRVGWKGAFSEGKDGNLIELNTQTHDKDTLLHEIQHAVQSKENFTFGGSESSRPVKQVADYIQNRQNAILDSMIDPMPYFHAWAAKKGLGDARWDYSKSLDENAALFEERGKINYAKFLEEYPQFKGVEEANKKIWEKASLMTPHEVYHRLAGEVEARNVASRSTAGTGEAPWATEDTPENRQFLMEKVADWKNLLGMKNVK